MMTTSERYTHDYVFRKLVDQLYFVLSEGVGGKIYTATELREAVLFASEMYEVRHVRPVLYPWPLAPLAPPPFVSQHNFGPARPTGKYKTGVFGRVEETYRVCSKCALSDVYLSRTYINGELCLPLP